MALRTVTVVATSIGGQAGPFNITDDLGNTVATNVTQAQILAGISFSVDVLANTLFLTSTGRCDNTTPVVIQSVQPSPTPTATISISATATPTPTPTISSTPSISVSISTTPTVTPSISLTPTRTPSISITPSSTATPTTTPTPTATPTATPTNTPTITPSPSSTSPGNINGFLSKSPSNAPGTLRLIVNGSIEVELGSNGATGQYVLNAGDTYRATLSLTTSSFERTLSMSSTTKGSLDQIVRLCNESGQLATLTYTADAGEVVTVNGDILGC